METRYKQINDLIASIATSNPAITTEQITKVKSLYNGDPRPIEEIESELLTYSEQLAKTANGKDYQITVKDPEKVNPVIEDYEFPQVEELLGSEESYDINYRRVFTSTEPANSSDDELDAMFAEYEAMQAKKKKSTQDLLIESVNEQSKNFVKTMDTAPESPSMNSNGGYGNIVSLLTLTIILSILTIIMASITIIAK